MKNNANIPVKMTAEEKRVAMSLASLFAFRMFGLFLLFPVFAVLSSTISGGGDPLLQGIALGAYGITQAFLLIPFGAASDRWGRKPVVLMGLVLFIVGAVVCAVSNTIYGIIVGRAIQGAGAVSAAISAWVADSMHEGIRTRAMAMVGSSIGLAFALSVVVSPLLAGWVGLSGLFWVVTLMGVGAGLVAWFLIPEPETKTSELDGQPRTWSSFLQIGALWRLNFGVFIVHACMMGLFLLIPHWILQQQPEWGVQDLWKIYLPVILMALFLMVWFVIKAERAKIHIKMLRTAAFSLAFCIASFAWIQHSFWAVVLVLTIFFTIFNVVEALQPSLIARLVDARSRGKIMGIYNVCQSLGVFFGGFVGGVMLTRYSDTIFIFVLFGLILLWAVMQLQKID